MFCVRHTACIFIDFTLESKYSPMCASHTYDHFDRLNRSKFTLYQSGQFMIGTRFFYYFIILKIVFLLLLSFCYCLLCFWLFYYLLFFYLFLSLKKCREKIRCTDILDIYFVNCMCFCKIVYLCARFESFEFVLLKKFGFFSFSYSVY